MFLFAVSRVSFRRKKKEGKEKGEAAAKSPTPKEEKVCSFFIILNAQDHYVVVANP